MTLSISKFLSGLSVDGDILLLSKDFNLINSFLNAGLNNRLTIVNESSKFEEVLKSEARYEILFYYDFKYPRSNTDIVSLLEELSKTANFVVVSFTSFDSSLTSVERKWPSFYVSLLQGIGIHNISTFGRNIFWDDQQISKNFTQSMLIYSRNEVVPISIIPFDVVHPNNLGVWQIDYVKKEYLSFKLRIINRVGFSRRAFVKKYLPPRLLRWARSWVRK